MFLSTLHWISMGLRCGVYLGRYTKITSPSVNSMYLDTLAALCAERLSRNMTNFLYTCCISLRNPMKVCVYALRCLCMNCVRAGILMILVSLAGNLMPTSHPSALNRQPYLPQAPNCTPASSCASTVTLCRFFPDRLSALLHELLPLHFGGGLAGRFWALRTRIPPCAGASAGCAACNVFSAFL